MAARARQGPTCVGRLVPPSWPGSLLGLVLCRAYVFQWGYDGKLLFAMIRSVLKSFKVPDVEVVAARMSNESAWTCMTDSTPKNLGHTQSVRMG